MMQKLKTLKYELISVPFMVITRPFKNFDAIKLLEIGKLKVGLFFLLIFGMMSIAEYQYLGFVLNENDPRDLNAFILLITSIFPLILLIIANWSITALTEGKGKMRDIFLTISYSLFPFIIARLIGLVFSNFIVEGEIVFYYIIYGIGLLWTIFVVVIGFVVIHEFTLSKTFITILFTVMSMMVISFVLLLFFGLIQELLGFMFSVGQEIIYRLRW